MGDLLGDYVDGFEGFHGRGMRVEIAEKLLGIDGANCWGFVKMA
jgi:hypothetical protein